MKTRTLLGLRGVVVSATIALALATTGCEDDAFCFDDCEQGTGGAGEGGSTTSGDGGNLFNVGAGGTEGGTGGGEECEPTGVDDSECDGVDNDCDGDIDEDVDFNAITSCGTCDNNCFTQLLNADPATITCDWDGVAGNPGTCAFGDCAQDFYDLNMDGLDCEYYCVAQGTDDTICNNTDDDCDGVADEGVDLCNDADNCGSCGTKCEVVHGQGACVPTGQMPCSVANTNCEIGQCDDDDMDGNPDWWDIDNLYTTGCEYNCSLTDGGAGLGVEVCGDGVDNDCDGAIDGADSDLSGDPQVGAVCFGDPDGLCADPAHAGVTACVGQQIVCQGPNVLFEDDMQEVCDGNSVDEDCDGAVDNSPVNAGSACGLSNLFPCALGTEQCINGSLTCIGNVDPGIETCNGVDDDCDGFIDSIGPNTPPVDTGGACDVPPPPPMNATSPCQAGTVACVGGTLVCQNSITAPSSTDQCGDDTNCDGQLTNQPNLASDVSNCGLCGNDCNNPATNPLKLNNNWSCQSGVCQNDGCVQGFHDLDNDGTCEYGPCLITGSEICDDADNDCNGTVDDLAPGSEPTPEQVCGVAPGVTSAECTTNVSVTCVNGGWQCGFPAGVCNPSCAGATEICDNLDNDCDGSLNENVPNWGLACSSDDGIPFPGHGACQTQGSFVCSGPNATTCSAVKASCSGLPGGCTEVCDGEDNDCDGLVDENYLNKGTDPAFFVQPSVTQIAPQLWVMSYEASRPNAGPTDPGSGNGYHCTSCPGGIPPAPGGQVLDETLACSVPDRLPWFNVTPIEVEQTCDAIGGFICDLSEWQVGCGANANCDWGYNPSGGACSTPSTGSKFCNLEPYDFNSMVVGNQDGLLATGSPNLANCWADWSGLFGNTEPEIFDITGNLREITKNGSNVYPLVGGAYSSNDYGATCDFDFYVVDETFKLLDTGFRCCFDSDPRL